MIHGEPSDEALGLAARQWSKKNTCMLPMQEEVAKEFARLIDERDAEIDRLSVEVEQLKANKLDPRYDDYGAGKRP